MKSAIAIFLIIAFQNMQDYEDNIFLFDGSRTVCISDWRQGEFVDEGEIIECVDGLCPADMKECEFTDEPICPKNFAFNESSLKCEKTVQCEAGFLTPPMGERQQCILASPLLDRCREPYKLLEGICQYDPCIEGNIVNNVCVASARCDKGVLQESGKCTEKGNVRCPIDESYDCIEYEGKFYCSSECIFYASSPDEIGNDNGTQIGENDYLNDGTIDEDTGECKGEILIFNGSDRRCRTDGVTTAWDNCCEQDQYLMGFMRCREDEIYLRELLDRDVCQLVGTYCSKSVDNGLTEVCIEKSETYCCFESELALIFHQDGRQQLRSFDNNMPFGTPENPVCRGFTLEELSMIEFTDISFSRYGDSISRDVPAEKKDMMRERVSNFINDTHGKKQ
ncbi:MAG: conjugal transfer protein TraN [bacterium]|nr:conjugal transfer protein TraN [bacterium]